MASHNSFSECVTSGEHISEIVSILRNRRNMDPIRFADEIIGSTNTTEANNNNNNNDVIKSNPPEKSCSIKIKKCIALVLYTIITFICLVEMLRAIFNSLGSGNSNQLMTTMFELTKNTSSTSLFPFPPTSSMSISHEQTGLADASDSPPAAGL
jgi:hypothetical protein